MNLRMNKRIKKFINDWKNIWMDKRIYSDNQKTVEQEDDIKGILKWFCVVSKHIALLVTY